jgi:hypothetical protein
MSLDWFRSWHGAPTDNKWLVIAKRADVPAGMVSAVVWALFDHASQNESRGSVEDFDVETYATFSGFDEAKVAAIIAALNEKSVIVSGVLSAWQKRQPKREDNSTERVREHRNAMKRNETHGNAREDKEEIREEKKESGAVAPREEAFEEFWKAYPRRMGANPKAPAEKLFAAAVKSGADPAEIIAGATRCATVDAAKINTEYIPQAVKWLRDKRWRDYLDEPAAEEFVPDWDGQIVRWLRGQGWSTRWYGAEPGQPGCKVPAEILTKHGVLSEDRKIFAA